MPRHITVKLLKHKDKILKVWGLWGGRDTVCTGNKDFEKDS